MNNYNYQDNLDVIDKANLNKDNLNIINKGINSFYLHELTNNPSIYDLNNNGIS